MLPISGDCGGASLEKAMQNQSKISWEHLVNGRLSRHSQRAHKQHYAVHYQVFK